MDGEISARLMKLAGRHPALDRFWVFCARYLILGLGAWYLFVTNVDWSEYPGTMGRDLLTLLAAVVVNETVSWGIGYLRFRPRPFVENHLTPLVRIAPGMKSFPSDHAVLSFTVATAMLLVPYPPTAGLIAVALAVLISVARVVCGVHYPSDVAAGAVLGTVGTVLTISAIRAFGVF
ncbi:phosphatase PAP2 family protein [Patescibacteria group bacterium]|nr:MAG: phosphatase PAP2 family protein [Patescibacteria group bacterium]